MSASWLENIMERSSRGQVDRSYWIKMQTMITMQLLTRIKIYSLMVVGGQIMKMLYNPGQVGSHMDQNFKRWNITLPCKLITHWS